MQRINRGMVELSIVDFFLEAQPCYYEGEFSKINGWWSEWQCKLRVGMDDPLVTLDNACRQSIAQSFAWDSNKKIFQGPSNS